MAKSVDNSHIISKIVTELLKEGDKKRIFEVLRNLNSKHEYAAIAHALLAELLPRFRSEDYLEAPEYKGSQGDLKEAFKIMSFYSQKHVERAERGLKKEYYPEYVLSQMTIDEEIKTLNRHVTSSETFVEDMWQEVKTKASVPKTAKQIKQQLKKRSRVHKVSDNLF